MAFQPTPNAAVGVIHFTLLTSQLANVLNFQHGTVPDQTAIDALATAIDAWVTSDYLPLISASVHYDRVEVRGLSSSVDLAGSNSDGAADGGLAGLAMAANTSLCLTLRTASTGRSARGRVYLVPTSSGEDTDAQTFGAAYTADAQVAFQNLSTRVSAVGWTWSVLSRRNGGVLLPAGVTRPITTVEARNRLIDSQRGRLANNH